MAVAVQQEVNIGQHLPWVSMMLDYTDKLIAKIPEDKLDWRPEDPNGHFMFSLGELAMHIADSRLMFVRQISGSESKEGYWLIEDETPPAEEAEWVWRFPQDVKLQAILDSLALARREVQPYLDLPVDQLNTSTDGTHKIYADMLMNLQKKGEDVSLLEARGPATINRVLFALVAHESGHRGSLQTLLRINGVDARGEM